MSGKAFLLSSKTQALLAGSSSGLLAFLAFPPADLGLLGFVALVPLAWFFRDASGRSLALASLAFGLAFFGPLIWWIRLFGSLAYVGLVLAQTLWVVLALQAGHFIKGPLGRLPGRWPVLAAFPIAFVAGEYLRSHLPLGGFGWGGLGYTQHDNLMALKLTSLTGVWGLSLLLAVVNTLVAEAVVRLRYKPLRAGPILAGALALALFPFMLPAGSPDGKQVKVAMVQGNVPENTYDPLSDDFVVLENHLRLTRKIRPGDASVVVWPEGTFDRDPSRDDRLGGPLVKAVRETKTPFLVGAILATRQEGKIRNSTLFLKPDGTVAGVYSKQHPVPFGEYVPFRSVLAPVVKELERIPNDQIPGEESTVFALPEGKLASVICYESTYPALVRSFVRNGARLLVVSTNDSSFERTYASEQHVAFSQVRAAEHRMWVAHTAVSGISAVVGPDGKILERSKLFEPKLFLPQMRFATTTTLYAKIGDWLPALVLAALTLLAAAEVVNRAKGREPVMVKDRAEDLPPANGHGSFREPENRPAPDRPIAPVDH